MADKMQHFDPSEREFIDRTADWIKQVKDKNTPFCTYFLNPREIYILQTFVNAAGLRLYQLPERAEYAKALIAPDFYQLTEADVDVSLVQMDYSGKFRQLTHSQILGTVLGETGLDRREIGDILVTADRVQIFVTTRFVPYLIDTVKKISGVAVKLK